MIPEVVRDRDLDAADHGGAALLEVLEDRDHEFHVVLGEEAAFLCEIIDLCLCPWGDVGVHSADTRVARVDGLTADDLADGLSNFTESLDPEGNAPDRFFLGERVDLRIGSWYMHVRKR